MAKNAKALGQDPEYERFLHASVGQDQKGFVVSVLSMLARLGVDPWREAEELAELPENAARNRLEALTTMFADVPSLALDHRAIVARLIVLLPHRESPRAATPRRIYTDPFSIVLNTPIYVLIMIVLLLAQLFYFGSRI